METCYSDWADFDLDDLKLGIAGAERAFLEAFASAILHGETIKPELQTLVNAIVAKAIFEKKLPDKPKGRPGGRGINSNNEFQRSNIAISVSYWELRDQGISYAQVVEIMSQRFHMSERHLMRCVSKYKLMNDKEYREKRRDFIEWLHKPGAEELLAKLTKLEDNSIDDKPISEIREELELLIRTRLDTALATLDD